MMTDWSPGPQTPEHPSRPRDTPTAAASSLLTDPATTANIMPIPSIIRAAQRVRLRNVEDRIRPVEGLSLSPGQRWGLGVNAYLYFFASAVLASKSNVADEGIPTDS